MELRLPSGGGGLFADFFVNDHRAISIQDTADIWPDVEANEVVAALQQLFEGTIEYVGLIGDMSEVQTADAGGGYVLERDHFGTGFVRYPSNLTAEQVQAAFLAFHAGDRECGLDWGAAAQVEEPKKKRGFFRRG
jgi:hypothetical protein